MTTRSMNGDVNIKTVQKMFVPLPKRKFGMFGLDSSAPKGWNYENLGMGNHLIVRDDSNDTPNPISQK